VAAKTFISNTTFLKVDASQVNTLGMEFQRKATVFRSQLLSFLKVLSPRLVKHIRDKGMSGRPGIISRTGRLRTSLTSDVISKAGGVSSSAPGLQNFNVPSSLSATINVYTNSLYWRTHTEGLTIRAKGADMPIPLYHGLTFGGPGGAVFGFKKWQSVYSTTAGSRGSGVNQLVFMKVRGKKYLMEWRTGNFTHILKRQVRVPKRIDVPTIVESFVADVAGARMLEFVDDKIVKP